MLASQTHALRASEIRKRLSETGRCRGNDGRTALRNRVRRFARNTRAPNLDIKLLSPPRIHRPRHAPMMPGAASFAV